MRRLFPRDDLPSVPLTRRLDREINPFLMALMVGLLILNLIRLATVGFADLPITRVDPGCLISPASTTGVPMRSIDPASFFKGEHGRGRM